MSDITRACPDCSTDLLLPRRSFLRTAGAAAMATAVAAPSLSFPNWAVAKDVPSAASQPESLVKVLFESLTELQRKDVCFDWDYNDTANKRGLLRTFVANNWQITKPELNGDFYTKDQRHLVREIFKGIINPEWVKRVDKQLEDDAGGFGNDQSFAIFGKPGDGKFEFVMTGRHMTLRCDGNSTDHVAFGGPIFYGHAADGFNEKADHPGNVYWPQALAANKVYEMLDEKQRKQALISKSPSEQAVHFQGSTAKLPGIAVGEMSSDQTAELQKVLAKLIEPYRQSDRDEVLQCLKTQGGLEKCSLAFYSDKDIGNDKVWDCWRLEGPSFVWAFRGSPHVHVWVNIADDATVKTNTGAYL